MKTKTLLTLTALTSVLMAGCTNDEPLVTLQKDNHGPIGRSEERRGGKECGS